MATLLSQVKGFITQQNNAGSRGLALINQCIDHMFEHRDWTPLAHMLAKSDHKDSSIYRAIVRETTGGLRLDTSSKEAKEQPSGMRIVMGNNSGPSEKMPILRQLVAEGESFRGKRVSEELLAKPAPEFDFHRWVKNALKKMEKEGKTISDLLNEVASLEKEASQIDVTEPEHMDNKKVVQPMKAA